MLINAITQNRLKSLSIKTLRRRAQFKTEFCKRQAQQVSAKREESVDMGYSDLLDISLIWVCNSTILVDV